MSRPRRSTSSRSGGLAVLLLLLATGAFAQMKENIRVDLIEVPVTVVDRSGNPVRGLTKENFRILDDGKEREITGFDMIDLSLKEQTALAQMNPAARRNFMLLFDLSFTSPRSLANAQEAATNFVKKSVLPRDRVAVATLDLEHGFHLLTNFTSDRGLIATAITNPSGFTSADPLQLSNEVKVATLDTSQGKTSDMIDSKIAMMDKNARTNGMEAKSAQGGWSRKRTSSPIARLLTVMQRRCAPASKSKSAIWPSWRRRCAASPGASSSSSSPRASTPR